MGVVGVGPRPKELVPYPALAFDLDRIHGLASAATDREDLLQRLQQAPRDAMCYERSLERPPINDPTERMLIAEVCAKPSDPTPAHVYADWLDEHGRGAEANLLRPSEHVVPVSMPLPS